MRPHRYTNVAVLGVPFPGATFGSNFTTNQYQLSGAVYGAPSLLPGWTFTRASTGYAETAAGTLTSFASGAPRITDKGLLVEEARTNLLLRSQEFDNASWTKSSSTVTANTTTAPDGTSTADSLIEDTSNNQHRTSQAVTVSNTTAYTFSVYAKANTRLGVYLRIITATTVAQAAFNLQTGAINSNLSGSATITALANGWYRCTVTGTTDGTTATCYANLQDTAAAAGISSYTGDGTSGLYLWGAQIEAGAFPTSYIPTTTASATRAADQATLAGLSLPAPVTTLFDVLGCAGVSTDGRITLSDGSGNNRMIAIAGATVQATQTGNNIGVGSATAAYAAGVPMKIGISFDGTTALFSIDGTTRGGGAGTAFSADLTRLDLANASFTAGRYWNNFIRRIVIWPAAHSQATLNGDTT